MRKPKRNSTRDESRPGDFALTGCIDPPCPIAPDSSAKIVATNPDRLGDGDSIRGWFVDPPRGRARLLRLHHGGKNCERKHAVKALDDIVETLGQPGLR